MSEHRACIPLPRRQRRNVWTAVLKAARRWTRRLAALVAAAAAIGFGGFIATLWGAEIDKADLQARLAQANREIISGLDQVMDEFRSLDELIASSEFPRCSSDSLELFRRVLFELHFLRDIGFVQQRTLMCSTAIGVVDQPAPSSAPDLVLADGLQVYAFRPVRISTGQSTMVLQRRTYNALVDPGYIAGLSTVQPVATVSIMASRHGPRFPLHDAGREITDPLTSVECSSRWGFCVEAGASRSQGSPAPSQSLGLGVLGAGSGLAVFLLGQSVVLRSQNPGYRLKRAIRRRDLRAVYQPIYSMPAGKLVGAELLARWPDAPPHLASAERFVAEAEAHGLIQELTMMMIETAAGEIGDWLIADPCRTLAVNISAHELVGDQLPKLLQRCFIDLGIQPSQIVLELTERSVASPRREQLDQLAAEGFQIYVDDLGEGFSSLSYLHHLPLSGVKISRSFSSGLGTDSPKVDLVIAMIELARKRNLAVVLEGIETRHQHLAMMGLGPLACQGFHYAMPMCADDLHRAGMSVTT